MNMNKKKIALIIFILALILLPMTVGAEQITGGPIGHDFCVRTSQTWRFLGWMLLFARIMVPFVIIFMGTIDFYKATVAEQSDEMKNQLKTFSKRLLAGFMIFMIPTILHIFFTLITNWSDVADHYWECATCLLRPTQCDWEPIITPQPPSD